MMKLKLFLFISLSVFAFRGNCQECLVAQYLFSGNANDNIGANNGIVYNATLCPDRFGNPNSAYNFNGSTSTYIKLPSTNFANNQYSYSLWVNLNSLPTSGSIGFMLSIGSSSSAECQSLNIQNQYLSSTNTWGGGGYNVGSPDFGLATSNSANLGQWYHIASVRGSNYAKYYVNGIQVDSVGTIGSMLPDYGNTLNSFIGKRSNNSSPVDAKIDDIGIYNCALNDAQVDSIYKAQKSNNCLLAQYLFSGNVNDNIGANNGIVYNATLCPDRFGNPNSAYNFNGSTSTYIELPSTNLVNYQYSYSLWVNLNSLPTSGGIGFMLSIGSVSSAECQSLNIQNQYLSSTNTWGGGGYNIGSPDFGLATSNTVNLGQWYHIVSVRGSNYAKYYVNGIKVDSVGTIGTMLPDYGNTINAFIGKRSNDTSPVNAKIDDVEIYSCALSNLQVDSIYKAQNLTGIQQTAIKNNPFNIFPNPTKEDVSITGISGKTILKLHDIFGKLILVKEVSNDLILNTNMLLSGVYLISMEKEGVVYFNKLIVAR